MSGNQQREAAASLTLLYEMQKQFQFLVTGKRAPFDDKTWFSYHMLAMQEELGEVLKADKRWKTHRNDHFDPESKLEEMADVFITVMNMAMFSGISCETLMNAVDAKIQENFVKFTREKHNDSCR